MSDIALEPTSKKNRRKLTVSLSGYEHLEPDRRPQFDFKRLSFRRFREAAESYDALADSKAAGDALDTIIKILKPNLLGWRNVDDFDGNPVEFDRDRLEDVVDLSEAQELLGKLMKGGVTEGDIKNSMLPPR